MDVVDRYLDMESILEDINQSFIALPSDEVADNNLVLHEILMTIINLMKDSDDLFAELFEKLFYGGSYWDGVKVTRPDEYDVHVQCNLQYDAALKPSDVPGWVTLQFHDMGERRYRNRFEPYYGIDGLHILINEDDYLDTEKVMVWFHQTLSVALGGTKKGKQRQTVLQTRHGTFNLSFERHGPAFTFHINGWVNGNEVEMNLDFVPSFVFEKWQYPKRGFRQNRTSKGETFIVAKPLNTNVGTRYWRLSFQNQERELIKDRVHFKPALRLLKKMRDRLGHECIASYFIKNLMLLELDKRDDDFWNNPLSYVFMEMLKDYQRAIRNGVIEFYWYKKDNLISNIPYEDLEEISKELSRIIKTINRSPGNDSIAKFFLTKSEYKEFMRM